MATLLARAIERYRCKSFENFGLEIAIHKHASELGSDDEARSRNTLLLVPWMDQEKSIEVRIRNGKPQISYLGRWCAVGRLLRHFRRPSPDNLTSQEAYHQQWNWWKTNGEKFRLLDLPPEIRDTIYGHSCGSRVVVGGWQRGQYSKSSMDMNTALPRVCRQVHKEFSRLVALYTTFCFDRFDKFKRLAHESSSQLLVRRVELSLSHHESLKLWGFQPGETSNLGITPSRSAKALRTMAILQLDLHMAAPSFATTADWLDGACQRAVCGFILRAAWPYVKGHPVKVTGYIKTDQKAAYEAACSKERDRVLAWQRQRLAAGSGEACLSDYDEWLDEEEGGVSLLAVEGTAAEDTATLTVADLACVCEMPCIINWDADT